MIHLGVFDFGQATKSHYIKKMGKIKCFERFPKDNGYADKFLFERIFSKILSKRGTVSFFFI